MKHDEYVLTWVSTGIRITVLFQSMGVFLIEEFRSIAFRNEIM